MPWGKAQRSDDSAEAVQASRRKVLPGFRVVRRMGGLIGVIVLALGLSACSPQDEPEPDPLDTIEVDPPPETTPDPGDEADADDDEPGPVEYEHPVPAPEIDDDGQAGAEAAAVYFVELFSYVHATGDFEAWDELTTDDCNFCRDVRERISELYAAGGYGVAEEPVFESLTPHLWDSSPGDYSVDVLFRSPAIRTFDADGRVLRDYEEAPARTWVLVEFKDQRWHILGAEGGSVE